MNATLCNINKIFWYEERWNSCNDSDMWLRISYLFSSSKQGIKANV